MPDRIGSERQTPGPDRLAGRFSGWPWTGSRRSRFEGRRQPRPTHPPVRPCASASSLRVIRVNSWQIFPLPQNVEKTLRKYLEPFEYPLV